MANGSVPNKDPFTYAEDRRRFLEDLQRFHTTRGTPFDRIPQISGREIDLYSLYRNVTVLGGWQKVNNDLLWEDLQEDFNIPVACTNGAQALKYIYFRYLHIYEKVHFLGLDPDNSTDEQEDGPTRKKICLPVESIPLSYNYNQHKVQDHQRESNQMSILLAKFSDYEKLEMSLRSGLPNEVDFVLNVCLLLSNEGRHVLKLNKSLHLLSLLMANIGIFEDDEGTMEDVLIHSWTHSESKRDFLRFWYDVVKNDQIREYIRTRAGVYKREEMVGNEVLHLGRELGAKDAEGQRVLQVAVLIRNLSFEGINQKFLASSAIVFRFLMLCVHSSYSSLQQLALDTLGNLAGQMVLQPVEHGSTKLVISLIKRSLLEPDKFVIVRAMEMLSKLCQLEKNEAIISESLGQETYTRMVQLLTVHDIQLIVHTLEALFRLSELGEATTTMISSVKLAVDLLVNLITVEAQSYGPDSLIGIKVVEYVPPMDPTAVSSATPQSSRTVIQPVAPNQALAFPVPPSTQLSASEQAKADVETTAANWLQGTFETKKGSSLKQADLVADYHEFCRKFGITDSLSSSDLMSIVKSTIPQAKLAEIDRGEGQKEPVIKGLSKRAKPKPFAILAGSDKVYKPSRCSGVPVNSVRGPGHAVNWPLDPLVVFPPPALPPPPTHSPTLRQRLMEPPQVPLQHQHVNYAGATTTGAPPSPRSSASGKTQPSSKPSPGTSRKRQVAPAPPVQPSRPGPGAANPPPTQPAVMANVTLHQRPVSSLQQQLQVASPPMPVSSILQPAAGQHLITQTSFPTPLLRPTSVIPAALTPRYSSSVSLSTPLAVSTSLSPVASSSVLSVPATSPGQQFPLIHQALQGEGTPGAEKVSPNVTDQGNDTVFIKSLLAKKVCQNRVRQGNASPSHSPPPHESYSNSPSSFSETVQNHPQPSHCDLLQPSRRPQLPATQHSAQSQREPHHHTQQQQAGNSFTLQQNQVIPFSQQQPLAQQPAPYQTVQPQLVQRDEPTAQPHLSHHPPLVTLHQNQQGGVHPHHHHQAVQVQHQMQHAGKIQHQQNVAQVPQQVARMQQMQQPVQVLQKHHHIVQLQHQEQIAHIQQQQQQIEQLLQQHTGVQPHQEVASMEHLLRQGGRVQQQQLCQREQNFAVAQSVHQPHSVPSHQVGLQQQHHLAQSSVLSHPSSAPVEDLHQKQLVSSQTTQHQTQKQDSQTSLQLQLASQDQPPIWHTKSQPQQALQISQGHPRMVLHPQVGHAQQQVQVQQKLGGQHQQVVLQASLHHQQELMRPQQPVLQQQAVSQAQPNLQHPMQQMHSTPVPYIHSQGQPFIPGQSQPITIQTQSQQPVVIQLPTHQVPQITTTSMSSVGIASISSSLAQSTVVSLPSTSVTPYCSIMPQQTVSTAAALTDHRVSQTPDSGLAIGQQENSKQDSENVSVCAGSVSVVQGVNTQTDTGSFPIMCKTPSQSIQNMERTVSQLLLTDTVLDHRPIPSIPAAPDVPAVLSSSVRSLQKASTPSLSCSSPPLLPYPSSVSPSSSVSVSHTPISSPGSGTIVSPSSISITQVILSSQEEQKTGSNHPHIIRPSAESHQLPAKDNGHVKSSISVSAKNECNGLGEVNGGLGSPHSVCSDLPPSPKEELKSQSQGHIPNGLPEGNGKKLKDGGQFSKELLHSVAEKMGKVNGVTHHLENGDITATVCSMGFDQDSNLSQPGESGVAPEKMDVDTCNKLEVWQVNGLNNHNTGKENHAVQTTLTQGKSSGQVFVKQTSVEEISMDSTDSKLVINCSKASDSGVRPLFSPDGSHDSDVSCDSFASSLADSVSSDKHSSQGPHSFSKPSSSAPSPSPSLSSSSSVFPDVPLVLAGTIPMSEAINKKNKKKAPAKPKSEKPAANKKRKAGKNGSTPDSPASSLRPTVTEYMCEWSGCKRCFESARLVFIHATRTHVPAAPESLCQWHGCEPLRRKRWSLVTHIQDHHCSEAAQRTACQRRIQAAQTASASPQKPASLQQAPALVYPPDAAMQAIKRFHIKPPFAEFSDQREGPVTKHIRLTAALILRNLARYSALGRSQIKHREKQLSYVTMSACESSTALAGCLWEILHNT